MGRMMTSAAKQEALVRLMSSDPSLLSGLDDDLLASITLASTASPPTPTRVEGAGSTATLKSANSKKSTTSKPKGEVTAAARRRPARANVQLYEENATFLSKARPAAATEMGKRPEGGGGVAQPVRPTTVLLSPSSSSAAVAAIANTKNESSRAIREVDTTASRDATKELQAKRVNGSAQATRKKDRPLPVVLLDAGALELACSSPQAVVSNQQEHQEGEGNRNSVAQDAGYSSSASTPSGSPSAYASLASYSYSAVATARKPTKSKGKRKKQKQKQKQNGVDSSNQGARNPADGADDRELSLAAERELANLMRIRSIEAQYEFGRPATGLTGFHAVENNGRGGGTTLASSAMTIESTSTASDSDEGQHLSDSCLATSSIESTVPTTTSRFVLDHRCFVARDQWVQRSSRKACYVCMRDFGVLRKRHSCRMCGEVICSRCSVFREVDLPVLENKFRICSCCFMAYRKKMDNAEQQGQAERTDAEDLSTSPFVPEELTGEAVNTSSNVASAEQAESSAMMTPLPVTMSQLQYAVPLSPPPSLSRSSSDLSSSRNTMNTMSDYSFCSDTPCEASSLLANTISPGRNIEEELEAALKAKQLEKEVEASQQRIKILEQQIADQESQKDLLSSEQQSQLQDARATIQLLQERLRMQELNARQAAHTRDSICLSKLRQTELYSSSDDESAALKKKLKILERQLQHAGISVAEVIPYEVAKRKVAEISKRMQEIGSSEVVLEDKEAQVAARKEYYVLEQDMEKYHTALVMTDEYIEEQRRKDFEWEEVNRVDNLNAARLLRSAMPVDISRMSEKDLVQMTTPTGAAFPGELARRLKRTNVLQLLRVDPKTITKMHPSVIEGYRMAGLTLLERRALHHVLQEPFLEWKKQQKEEMAQKKYVWYSKLKDALVLAVANFEAHCSESGDVIDLINDDALDSDKLAEIHNCKLLGMACPVRSEAKVRRLYGKLGFSPDAEYFKDDILKGDPEGAGEKALLEVQAHAREMVANQRQRSLKEHYKMSMRDVAQALGALEEMDTTLARVRALDEAFPCPVTSAQCVAEERERGQLLQCNALLTNARELVLLLARRAGICLTGKRDPTNDTEDTRSPMEVCEATEVVAFLKLLLADIQALLFEKKSPLRSKSSAVPNGTFQFVRELLHDVSHKNAQTLGEVSDTPETAAKGANRVPWAERKASTAADTQQPRAASKIASSGASSTVDNPPRRPPVALSTSALLFDAIKARRKKNDKKAGANAPELESNEKLSAPAVPAPAVAKPMDLMAAIRARKCKQQEVSSADVQEPAP